MAPPACRMERHRACIPITSRPRPVSNGSPHADGCGFPTARPARQNMWRSLSSTEAVVDKNSLARGSQTLRAFAVNTFHVHPPQCCYGGRVSRFADHFTTPPPPNPPSPPPIPGRLDFVTVPNEMGSADRCPVTSDRTNLMATPWSYPFPVYRLRSRFQSCVSYWRGSQKTSALNPVTDRTWAAMRDRLFNAKCSQFGRWGGRCAE